MSDVIGQTFEIAQAGSAGAAAIAEWISTQVSESNATHVIATLEYQQGAQGTKGYAVVLMATNLSNSPTQAVGPYVAAAQFDIRNGIAALLTWLNAQETGVVAPAAPGLSLVAAGALTSQGTIYAKVTLVTPYGETAASTEASEAVTDNHELVVASPALDAGGLATGWNVYLSSATGGEKKQNVSPIAIGTAYTLTAAVGTSGATAPGSNATGAQYLRHVGLVDRFTEKLVTVVVSN